jgi:GNAT superfamily N-acetyltransferase
MDDAQAIAAQNILLAKESEQLTLTPETILAGVKAVLSNDTKGFYVVAEQNSNIVGQVMITFEWSDWRNTSIWWVQSVYVQKEWRKKGVFTKLLLYVQKKAAQEHVAFLRLYAHKNNISALRTYEKTGWKPEPYVLYHLPADI